MDYVYYNVPIFGYFDGSNFFSLVGDSVELARWCSGKESAFQFRRFKRPGFNPWVGKIPLE